MSLSEEELVSEFAKHKDLVIDCASGALEFWDFVESYNNFYHFYALDGHESNTLSSELLAKFSLDVEFHRKISEQVLSLVCSDDDAAKPDYIKCGRISSTEAVKRLQQLVRNGI